MIFRNLASALENVSPRATVQTDGDDTRAASPLTESSDLHPGEEYTYLLTPSLPFEPDFFETFATLFLARVKIRRLREWEGGD
jgi:hypothetical protein